MWRLVHWFPVDFIGRDSYVVLVSEKTSVEKFYVVELFFKGERSTTRTQLKILTGALNGNLWWFTRGREKNGPLFLCLLLFTLISRVTKREVVFLENFSKGAAMGGTLRLIYLHSVLPWLLPSQGHRVLAWFGV